jgi:hypothetical protein
VGPATNHIVKLSAAGGVLPARLNPQETGMFAKSSRLWIAILVIQVLAMGSLSYSLYQKHDTLTVCQANLDSLRQTEAQVSANEARLERWEAGLDAAEAKRRDVKQ